MPVTRTSGQGRPKGLPNKATREAREAIARFVDGNVHRLQGWLDDIANGVPLKDAKGLVMLDSEGKVRWLVPPNPEKAAALWQNLVEYHVPKLARQEIVGPDGGALTINVNLGGASRAND